MIVGGCVDFGGSVLVLVVVEVCCVDVWCVMDESRSKYGGGAEILRNTGRPPQHF